MSRISAYVVSDSGGFVGAFLDRESVARDVLAEYPDQAFIIQVFPLEEKLVGSNENSIFAIPYYGCSAVAFVSNDPAKCKTVHAALVAVGMTYDDPIDYWKHPIGVLCAPAKARLEILKKGSTVAVDILEERLFDSAKPMKGGPIEQFLLEAERITIMSDIVPVEARTFNANAPPKSPKNTPVLTLPEAPITQEASAAPSAAISE